MDTLQFIKDISWQVVVLVALIVILVYRKPLGSLISNLRKGSVSYKKGEGVTGNLEVNNPAIEGHSPESLKQELRDTHAIEYVESSHETSENNVTESVVINQVSVEENKDKDDWISLSAEGEYAKAHELLLEEIRQLEANENRPLGYLLWLKCQAARILWKQDSQKGKEEFQKLTSENPESLMVYIQYFEILRETGDFDTIYSIIDKYPSITAQGYE